MSQGHEGVRGRLATSKRVYSDSPTAANAAVRST
jgi:hypothetical protein